MVRHVILWNLKEEFNTPDTKRGIKEGLEGLVGIIDGLVEIEVITDPLSTSNCDVMLWSVFESVEALANYAKHPEHIRVADTFVRPFTLSRVCMDYEV